MRRACLLASLCKVGKSILQDYSDGQDAMHSCHENIVKIDQPNRRTLVNSSRQRAKVYG
jgi:hypothetical protein